MPNPIRTCSWPRLLDAPIETAVIVGDAIWNMLAARRPVYNCVWTQACRDF